MHGLPTAEETMKAYGLAGLLMVFPGCALFSPSWKGTVEWPDERTALPVGSSMEAGAALAAAGAVREVIRINPHPFLFKGCSSPEQGLDVTVFTGPTLGLYYVEVHSRFDRCGGPVERVLDGWDLFAVTPQGEVVAKAPPPESEVLEFAPPHKEPPKVDSSPVDQESSSHETTHPPPIVPSGSPAEPDLGNHKD
jgi:hypothetical protein